LAGAGEARAMMRSAAGTLAQWAAGLEPTPDDLALAHRSLLDTVAVTLAARDHRVTHLAAPLTDDARWAVAGHVLDFDDLHMPSTAHVSAVCVPTALALGGGPRAYLAVALDLPTEKIAIAMALTVRTGRQLAA
jgi:2-methylcitrate dehydratase PrpD